MVDEGFKASSKLTLDVDGLSVCDELKHLPSTILSNGISLYFKPKYAYHLIRSKVTLDRSNRQDKPKKGNVKVRKWFGMTNASVNVGLTKDADLSIITKDKNNLPFIKEALVSAINVAECRKANHKCPKGVDDILDNYKTHIKRVPKMGGAAVPLPRELLSCYVAVLQSKLAKFLNGEVYFYLSVYNTKLCSISKVQTYLLCLVLIFSVGTLWRS